MFGKKTTVEDLLKAYAALSDEEKAKFEEKKEPAEDTKEQIDEAEENIEKEGADEQTEKDRVDESVAAQEEDEGDENTQDAKDRVDESEGEEDEEEEERIDKKREELLNSHDARIASLEDMVAEMSERLSAVVDEVEKGRSFGRSPELGEKKSEDTESPVYKMYYARAARR
nr:MAG TPA: hypothetical protein [Caudoviricetes sp.]